MVGQLLKMISFIRKKNSVCIEPSQSAFTIPSNFWCLCQNSFSWYMFFKEDHVVGTFKNICTLAFHCWYIKHAFAEFYEKIFLRKNISEDILVNGCFHLNSMFILKNSSPLQRCKSFMSWFAMIRRPAQLAG